jgi:beta-lactamase class A
MMAVPSMPVSCVTEFPVRLLLCGMLLLAVPAAFAVSPNAPTWPQLSDAYDAQLQQGLAAQISDSRLDDVVAGKRLAVALVDVTDPQKPRVAGVNEHEMMYAASLPKIAILLAAFQKAEDTGEPLNQSSKELLTRMIRDSSNAAAAEMGDWVGMEYIAKVLTSDRYKLYDDQDDGGIWVGKAYARRGAWRRDPLANLSHAASAFEVARFYYLLITGRLVSPGASAEMKQMLSRPAIAHKFVSGLAKARPGSRIYRKSGTWRTYHSDSALVERDGRAYIAVALCNDARCGSWLKSLIVRLDDLIFQPETVNGRP